MHFSVVIPLYNKEKHIKRAINSVLNQTYQNFEIIIINDGSTDFGIEEVKNIKDSRIKLYNKSNGGVSSARNYGIERSSHEYIGLLDADDMWQPTFLKSISCLIKEYPQAGAYATSYDFIRDKEVTPAKLNVTLEQGQTCIVDYFRGAIYNPLISASSVVIPKRVFENIGLFSTDITRGEDLEMWCRIALKYEIAFLNKNLASYFLDAENRSDKTPAVYSKSFMNRVEKILENQKKAGNNSLYFEEYMIGRIMSKVRYLIINNRKKEARKLLVKYRYTQYNKKNWYKNYILSFKPFYYMYEKLKSN